MAKAAKKKITKANMADTLRSLYESCFVKTKDTVTGVKRLNEDDERLMLKDPQWAYLYSKYVMQAPWSDEDEKVFFGHPKWAYLYSVFVHPSEGIKRHMMAAAIKDADDEWAKKYFDKDTGVDAIRTELKEEK
jgi:hypothetical protein